MDEKKESMVSESNLEKRKTKIANWIKNNQNLLFVGILILAFAVRFYIFILTKNQVLWWDEAGYFSQARSYVTSLPSGRMGGTEYIVPFIWAFLYKLYPGEILVRFGQLTISFLLVAVTYVFGRKLFNPTTGLIAAFFIACNGVALFFTGRLLIYSWPPVIITAILFFFYKGYVLNQGNKYTYLSMFLLSFGIIAYSTTFLAIPIIFLYLIFTEKFKFLRNKKLWKVIIIGFLPLLIYFIFSQIAYGYIHPRLDVAGGVVSNPDPNFANIFAYFHMSPHLFGWMWIVLFLVGVVFFLEVFLIFDIIIKGRANKSHKSKLFVLIWFIVIALFYTAYLTFSRPYDAFIMPILPPFAIIVAVGAASIKDKFIKNNKLLTLVLIAFILIAGAYQIDFGNKLIKGKLGSYETVRDAGIWMKQNSLPEDTIISKSKPQNIYYSERETLGYPETKEELDQLIQEKKPKYLVLSVFESHEPWLLNYPNNNSMLVPVQAYQAPNQQPLLVIYEVN